MWGAVAVLVLGLMASAAAQGPPRCFVDDDPMLEFPAMLPEEAPLPGPRVVVLAFETDVELGRYFATESLERDYLDGLFAHVQALYGAETNVQVVAGDVVIRRAEPDPWAAAAPGAALDELRGFYQARGRETWAFDALMLVSGKPVQGGVAWVNSLCTDYPFSVAQVYGSVASAWDRLVVPHEFAHTVGAIHTHCEIPPVDRCWNTEAGCWAGALQCSRGTIESYCHVCGGLGNIDFLFGPVVAGRMDTRLAAAPCLVPGVSTTTVPTTTRPSTTTTTLVDLGFRCDRARQAAARWCVPGNPFPRGCRRAEGRVDAECREGRP